MIDILVRWDTAEVRELMRRLQKPRLNQALSVAVNDSARAVERKAESLVSKTLSIPVKRARLGIWIRPMSNPSTLSATVRGSGSQIPLKAFNAKEEAGGVSAMIWGARQFHPGAFIFGGPLDDHNRPLGMGDHVFYRKGKTWVNGKRGPIARAKGASIAEAMTKEAVAQATVDYGADRMAANVIRQVKRYAFKQ